MDIRRYWVYVLFTFITALIANGYVIIMFGYMDDLSISYEETTGVNYNLVTSSLEIKSAVINLNSNFYSYLVLGDQKFLDLSEENFRILNNNVKLLKALDLGEDDSKKIVKIEEYVLSYIRSYDTLRDLVSSGEFSVEKNSKVYESFFDSSKFVVDSVKDLGNSWFLISSGFSLMDFSMLIQNNLISGYSFLGDERYLDDYLRGYYDFEDVVENLAFFVDEGDQIYNYISELVDLKVLIKNNCFFNYDSNLSDYELELRISLCSEYAFTLEEVGSKLVRHKDFGADISYDEVFQSTKKIKRFTLIALFLYDVFSIFLIVLLFRRIFLDKRKR
jgi:CHASE3 domain sensor protein